MSISLSFPDNVVEKCPSSTDLRTFHQVSAPRQAVPEPKPGISFSFNAPAPVPVPAPAQALLWGVDGIPGIPWGTKTLGKRWEN